MNATVADASQRLVRSGCCAAQELLGSENDDGNKIITSTCNAAAVAAAAARQTLALVQRERERAERRQEMSNRRQAGRQPRGEPVLPTIAKVLRPSVGSAVIGQLVSVHIRKTRVTSMMIDRDNFTRGIARDSSCATRVASDRGWYATDREGAGGLGLGKPKPSVTRGKRRRSGGSSNFF